MVTLLLALCLAVAGKGGLVACLSMAAGGVGALLVSIRGAAEQLGVSPDTVRRLAAGGQLKTTRISRRVLVPAGEIARLVEQGTGTCAGQKARVAK
jgi:excisionase family DNA binding protein